MSNRWVQELLVLACTTGVSCDGPPTGAEDIPLETGVAPVVDTATAPSIVVQSSGVVTCSDPSYREQQPFDVIQSAEWSSSSPMRMWGAGTTVADFDGDGRVDVWMFGDVEHEYFRQRADGDFDRDPEGFLQLGTDLSQGFGGSAADFDGDGDLDLYVSRYEYPNLLLINDGQGNFYDGAVAAGVEIGMHRSASSAWGDFDRDGDLDLFVSGHGLIIETGLDPSKFPPGEPSYLFENLGDGTFDDRSALISEAMHGGYTFLGAWEDIDFDGWPDLYLVNDLGARHTPCSLLWNRQGSFEEDANAAGIDLALAGMGLGIGDVNEDGVMDFLVPAWDRYGFMVSDLETGGWFNHSISSGLWPDLTLNQRVAWGAELADMDLDTDLDAVVVFGYLQTTVNDNTPAQPDALYLQEEGGVFVQVGQEWGVDDLGDARGVVVTDINGDGWLDIAKPDINGPSRIYLSRCGVDSWLRVQLRAPAPNTFGIGARVRVEVDERSWMRTVRAGGTGYGSGGPPEVHFGLAAFAAVDLIEVIWPDGTVSRVNDVAARQTITLIHQEG